MAWLITRRELREILRDANLFLPVLILPSLMGLLAGMMAFGSSGGQSSTVGTMVGTLAIQQIPSNALIFFGNLDTSSQEAMISLLLKAVAIPLYWVIPVALTSAVATDSFVGEKERETIEPLLASPVSDLQLFSGKLMTAIIPAVAGTWLGMGIFAGSVATSSSPFFPRFVLADPDWAFSGLVMVPLMALLSAAIAALISTRVASYRAAYQLNGLIVLPIILVLIPQTIVLFLITPWALAYIAAAIAVLDLLVVAAALLLFDRERLLRGS